MNHETTAKPRYKKIWIDPAVHKDLKAEASREGFSIKDYILHLLKSHKSHTQTTTANTN